MRKTNVAKQETKLVNEQDFRVFLAKRNLAEEIVQTHVNIVKESDKQVKEREGGKKIDKVKPDDFDDFSKILMEEKGITRAILITDAVK